MTAYRPSGKRWCRACHARTPHEQNGGAWTCVPCVTRFALAMLRPEPARPLPRFDVWERQAGAEAEARADERGGGIKSLELPSPMTVPESDAQRHNRNIGHSTPFRGKDGA